MPTGIGCSKGSSCSLLSLIAPLIFECLLPDIESRFISFHQSSFGFRKGGFFQLYSFLNNPRQPFFNPGAVNPRQERCSGGKVCWKRKRFIYSPLDVNRFFPSGIVFSLTSYRIIDVVLGERLSFLTHKGHPVMIRTTSFVLSWKMIFKRRPPKVRPTS